MGFLILFPLLHCLLKLRKMSLILSKIASESSYRIRPNSLVCIFQLLLIRNFDHFHVLQFLKFDHLAAVTLFDHLAGLVTFDNLHVMQFDHLEHTPRNLDVKKAEHILRASSYEK